MINKIEAPKIEAEAKKRREEEILKKEAEIKRQKDEHIKKIIVVRLKSGLKTL